MREVIHVADLQNETFELLEEESFDGLATKCQASELESLWETEPTELSEIDFTDAPEEDPFQGGPAVCVE